MEEIYYHAAIPGAEKSINTTPGKQVDLGRFGILEITTATRSKLIHEG